MSLEECLRLAEQLKNSQAEGKSNEEKMLSINKVLLKRGTG